MTPSHRSALIWTASQHIAKQLHPVAFIDVDPIDELRRDHEPFLPVAFEGAGMTRLT